MTAATITNIAYAKALGKLARQLHADIPIKARIVKDGSRAQVTVEAVKKQDYEAFPERRHDEWSEEMYESSDPTKQLWTGFHHMIEERDQTRIFGTKYADGDLLSRVRDLYAEYGRGEAVEIFLCDVYIADEFCCDEGEIGSDGKALGAVCDELRNLAYAESDELVDWQADSEEMDIEGEGVEVVQYKHGFYRVNPSGMDSATADAVVKAAQSAHVRLHGSGLGLRVIEAPLDEFRESYIWDVGVSELAAEAGEDSEATRAYARMARLAHEFSFRRARKTLEDMGVAEGDMVRWVCDHCGHECGMRFAGYAKGGIANGVRGAMSWSLMSGDGAEGGIEGQVSARQLRDMGRLGFYDNEVAPPPGTREGRLLVEGGAVVAKGSGTARRGRVADDVVIG